MENEFKKISSSAAVPKESDFINVILSLKERTPTLCTYEDDDDSLLIELIDNCSHKVSFAETRFSRMFFKVYDEFPSLSLIGPLYCGILHQRFNWLHYADAKDEVSFASWMMIDISEKYLDLISSADSLDKCKSLKRDAFACMLAVVRRCLPTLAFLDKVRDYMANLDEHASASASASPLAFEENKHDEGYPVPQLTKLEFEENFDHLIDPQTLVWLEELDRVPSRCLKDNIQTKET